MAIFKPRTSEPGVYDENWISVDYPDGRNECIVIDKHTGSVLPNCTGYAWGRWYELIGRRPCLCRGHAREWYSYRDGYSRGQVPALGAVACWAACTGGKYGHVAVVESIGPGYIMVSQSNYGGTRWELVRCDKMPNGRYKSHAGNTAFQGFIYNPVNFTSYGSDKPAGPYKSVDDIAKAIIRGTGPWYKCYGTTRWDKIRSYGFDPEEVQRRINQIMAGG